MPKKYSSAAKCGDSLYYVETKHRLLSILSVRQKQIYLFQEISKTQGKSLTQELYAKKVFECREMRGLPVLCGN